MRDLALLPLALAAILLAGVPAMAQVDDGSEDPEPKQVTLVAKESGCPDDRTFCFEVEEEPSTLSPGDEVNLTLRNDEANQAQHNAYVTTNDSADPGHQDTSADEAIANTTTIGPGENASTNFTVPDADALYVWCDNAGHEAAGMWTTFSLAENGTADNQTDANESENDTRSNESNESSSNESEENETEENESDDEEPLRPTEPNGEQEAPLGSLALVASVAFAAVVAHRARGRA